jgi:hypothetical protein
MVLLAEAYTLAGDKMIDNAIEIYEQLVKCRVDKPALQVELFRKMAPLYTNR